MYSLKVGDKIEYHPRHHVVRTFTVMGNYDGIITLQWDSGTQQMHQEFLRDIITGKASHATLIKA